MSEYCNKCSKEMLKIGENLKPDIDVYEIASELPNGCFKNILCEGCEMLGVSKNNKGEVFLIYPDKGPDGDETKLIPIKEWEKSSQLLMGEVTEVGFLGGILIESSGYTLKIIKGPIIEKIQQYHVIQEFFSERNTTNYSRLNEIEVSQRHNIDVVKIFEKIEKQTIFKT